MGGDLILIYPQAIWQKAKSHSSSIAEQTKDKYADTKIKTITK